MIWKLTWSIQCNDSHEFYERYRQVFPNKKKGIDSISKIWKRRSEYIKKQEGASEPATLHSGSSGELEILITDQNKILAELSGVMKEHLRVSKEILASLPQQIQKSDEPVQKTAEVKIPDIKNLKRKSVGKNARIL